MKIVTGQATQERDIAADTTFLAVPWRIVDDSDTLALEGIQAFPLEASEEEITAFLNKKLATYKENDAIYQASKEFQAKSDNAQVISDQVSNITIE